MRMKVPDFAVARKRMVQDQLAARGIQDPRVLDAIMKVPRHMFLEEGLWSQAYGDFPLPIGEGQTISQPYIVALMSEALELRGHEKVLEIGTGSGYQAAVLAELADRVFSIERIGSVGARARSILDHLGYANILIRIADGTYGWPEESPFGGVIVTAGAPEVPQPLVDQLETGGCMVLPVGDASSQDLIKVVKTEDGIRTLDLGGCRFVKLIGDHGWNVHG
jgi:protein-L-isoaspartate(D-aspartate) O-methyltransferase